MKKLFVAILVCFLSIHLYAQTDKSECINKAYSFFSGIDGFYLKDCEAAEYKSYDFWINSGAERITKAGKFKRVQYEKKKSSTRVFSKEQIFLNHANAAKAAKGEVLKGTNDTFKLLKNGIEIWILINTDGTGTDVSGYYVTSVEVEAMTQEVSAKDIDVAIKSEGKIALYNILFDVGKSSLKSESELAIKQIAQYLQNNPSEKIYIVGHTDNDGGLDLNIKLSKDRANAVKNTLITNHSVSAARLTADGAGPLCPVATNRTAEGKQLNRRVEIVQN